MFYFWVILCRSGKIIFQSSTETCVSFAAETSPCGKSKMMPKIMLRCYVINWNYCLRVQRQGDTRKPMLGRRAHVRHPNMDRNTRMIMISSSCWLLETEPTQ